MRDQFGNKSIYAWVTGHRSIQQFRQFAIVIGRQVPTRQREIVSRVNEINFNASLLSELRGVAFVNRLIDEGRLPRGTREGEFRRLKLHRIVMEDVGDTFGARSTLKTDYEYFETLRKLGQRATRRFLDRHFNDIGRRSTIDIADKIAAELAET